MHRPLVRGRFICAQCVARRGFKSTSSRQQYGPESPKYIEIPEPLQSTIPERPRVRGILPIPRDPLKGRHGRGLRKADDEWIARATKLSPKPRSDEASLTAQGAWKEKMADLRRRNLKEGLKSLLDRKLESQQLSAQRSKSRARERRELVDAPERDDERLTSPTVDPAIQRYLQHGVQAESIGKPLETMKTHVRQKEERRAKDREDALHSLYIEARSFITTPEQLDKAIDDAFGTMEHPRAFGGKPSGSSMWDHSRPASAADLLNRSNRVGGSGVGALDSAQGYAQLTKERIKRIAEELTGGRMDH